MVRDLRLFRRDCRKHFEDNPSRFAADCFGDRLSIGPRDPRNRTDALAPEAWTRRKDRRVSGAVTAVKCIPLGSCFRQVEEKTEVNLSWQKADLWDVEAFYAAANPGDQIRGDRADAARNDVGGVYIFRVGSVDGGDVSDGCVWNVRYIQHNHVH